MTKLYRLGVLWVLTLAVTIVSGCGQEGPPQEPAEAEVYRVGAAIPLTGPGAALGSLIKRGLELGVKEANTARPDHPIEIIFEDTKTNPKEGLTAFRKLVDVDNTKVVLVAFSAICNAVAPVAEAQKVLMVGMTTSMPGLTEGRQYVIRLFPNAEMLAGTMADYAKMHHTRAAVMYANDEYGKHTFITFKARFEGDGRQNVFSDAFSPTQKEFRETVGKMLASRPDVIYLPGYGGGYVALLKQIREQNENIMIMGDSPLSNPPVYKAAGDAADGVLVPATPLDAGVADTPRQEAFLAQYVKEFGENPSINVAINHDFVEMLSLALSETDGSPEAIRGFFLSQRPFHGLVGDITYQDDGESIVVVKPMRIENAQISPLD